MKAIKSDRGFIRIEAAEYVNSETDSVVIAESSAVGDYEDSFDKPGSSFLWVGSSHHLNREEVAALTTAMQHWLSLGRLPMI